MTNVKTRKVRKGTPLVLKAMGIGEDSKLGEGQFTAVVSKYGVVDCYDEVVMPGAFSKSLANWKASGDPIPVLWDHDWGDADAHIGQVIDFKDDANGLEITAQLDMSNPKAVQVFKLLKDRRVKEFSYAGIESDFHMVQGPEGEPIFQVGTIELDEVSVCLKGANPETELISTKSEPEPDTEVKKDDDDMYRKVKSIVEEILAEDAEKRAEQKAEAEKHAAKVRAVHEIFGTVGTDNH